MKKLLCISLLALSSSLFTGLCDAQLTILHNFDDTGLVAGNSNGAYPEGNLTPSLSGKVLYGMVGYGGAFNNSGLVFRIDSDGTHYKDLFDFDATDGAYPDGTLTLEGAVLFGMTSEGGAHGYGCVFKVDTDGTKYKDLLDFNNNNGATPEGALTLSANGLVLYGMTSRHGSGTDGNVFKIDTDGTEYKEILAFSGTNGNEPYGSLVLSGSTLYGMTSIGGASNEGLIFRVDTSGSNYHDMNDFNGTNGEDPSGTLLLLGGQLFGTTLSGGANSDACIFRIDTNGGGYKDLYDFSYATGAYTEYFTLLFSGDKFFGMTKGGGANGDGVIFQIDTNGSNYKDLLDFNSTNGYLPYASLTLLGNLFYGMTDEGGANDVGEIFSFDTTTVTTAVKQLKVESGQLSVYPNPSGGVFNVICHSERSEESQSITVYNVLGELVYSQLFIVNSQFSINLSSQPSGVYLYRVIANNGNVLGEGKLVIQK